MLPCNRIVLMSDFRTINPTPDRGWSADEYWTSAHARKFCASQQKELAIRFGVPILPLMLQRTITGMGTQQAVSLPNSPAEFPVAETASIRISRRFRMLTPEQVLAAQKTNLNAIFGLTGKVFESWEKLAELNIQTAKTALSEAAETTQAALSVKDAQEFLALQAALLQPSAEKAVAYSRHVYDIATTTSAEFSKLAEAQVADAQDKFGAAVDNATKNAPAGTENAVALVKSAVAAANNAYESVQKAVKQASDIVENNVNTVTNTALKTSQATRAPKRAAA
jgi:phasin family protein